MASQPRSFDDCKAMVKKAMGNMRVKFKETKPAQDHMIQLMIRFPYLMADAEEYNTHTAEGHLSCVRLHGVVTMQYRQSSYNIPMAIFVSSNYIQRAPILFVLETSSVAIKPQHPHVGPNGMVYLPYLHQWNEQSNLVQCLGALLAVFEQKPFVYARPPPGGAGGVAMLQSVGGQAHLMQTQAVPQVMGYSQQQQQQQHLAAGYPAQSAAQAGFGYQSAVAGYAAPSYAANGYPPLPAAAVAARGQQVYSSQAPPNPYTQSPLPPQPVGFNPYSQPPPHHAASNPYSQPPTAAHTPQVVRPPLPVPPASAEKPSSAIPAEAASVEAPEEFIDNFFMCEVMKDPVFADDGYTYERASIVEWLEKHDTSPATGGKLESKRVVPNHALRGRIIAWKEARGLPA